MSNIHFIGGEKGGVGKSLVARLLAQYMIDKQIPFLGYDTERMHASLMRFYADYASPVVVDRYESLDQIVEAAGANPDRRTVVDLAAQTHAPLVRWMEDSGVLDLAGELSLTIRYWHVMDSGADSVELLRLLLDRFGARLSYVLVLNQLREETFEILEKSGQKERAMELGGKVITIKRLHPAILTKIDAASSSFWAASNKAPAEGSGNVLGMLERQRVKVWLKNAYEQFDMAGV